MIADLAYSMLNCYCFEQWSNYSKAQKQWFNLVDQRRFGYKWSFYVLLRPETTLRPKRSNITPADFNFVWKLESCGNLSKTSQSVERRIPFWPLVRHTILVRFSVDFNLSIYHYIVMKLLFLLSYRHHQITVHWLKIIADRNKWYNLLWIAYINYQLDR